MAKTILLSLLYILASINSFAGNDGGGGGLTTASEFEKIGKEMAVVLKNNNFVMSNISHKHYINVLNSLNSKQIVIRETSEILNTEYDVIFIKSENAILVSDSWLDKQLREKLASVATGYSLVILETQPNLNITLQDLVEALETHFEEIIESYVIKNMREILNNNQLIVNDSSVTLKNPYIGIQVIFQRPMTQEQIRQHAISMQLNRLQLEALEIFLRIKLSEIDQ